MIVLTGGAGFIGSVLLKRLNDAGHRDILVVDSLKTSDKWRNLVGKVFSDYADKETFPAVLAELAPEEVDAIIHLGACTSTTERDADYLMRNNYQYSKALAVWCFENDKQFIYASSAATYGDGALGFSDDHEKMFALRPMNMYGYSKHLFDLWLLENGFDRLCTGFKFFNVFGPNEYHKGAMASLVYKAFHQIRDTGKMKLFKSYHPSYKDGESVRDFLYVKDCVDVLIWSLENRDASGIYNLGSGKARSWNDLAKAIFKAMGREANIEYVEMPEAIRPAYQYFTEADMTKLRSEGYAKEFGLLENNIADYVNAYLSKENSYQ